MISKLVSRIRMLVICLSAFVLGLAATGAKASTITVFTHLGPADTFNTNVSDELSISGANYFDEAWGMQFVAATTANLTDAVLALGKFLGDNSPITLNLESDRSRLPSGTILATLAQVGTIPPDTSPGLLSFDCSGQCPLLTSGTPYWFVATEMDANSDEAWFLNPTGRTGGVALNFSGSATGPWDIFAANPLAAFQIDGTTAVSEPGSLALVGLGVLCGLGGLWVEWRQATSIGV